MVSRSYLSRASCSVTRPCPCAQVHVPSPITMAPAAAPGASAAPAPGSTRMDTAAAAPAASTGHKEDAGESPTAAGVALQSLLGGSLAENLAAVEGSLRAEAAGSFPPLAGLSLAHGGAPAAPPGLAAMNGFHAGIICASDPAWAGPVHGSAPGTPVTMQG